MLRKFCLYLSTALLVACVSSQATTVETRSQLPAQDTDIPIRVDTHKSWTISPVTELQHYLLTATTTLELNGIRDSVSSRAGLTVAVKHSETETLFSGTLDSLSIDAGPKIRDTLEQSHSFPLAFAGTRKQSTITLEKPIDCRMIGLSPSAVIQRFPLSIPTELHSGLEWKDSTSASSCSGSIPTTLTLTRTYHVVGGENTGSSTSLIAITHVDTIESRGKGEENHHRVEVTSASSGSGQIWIDSQSGQLIKAIVDLRGSVAVTASGKTQVFTQITRETLSKAQ
jgi:hypothetical protein